MALAPYFGKTALSAVQALDTSYSEFKEKLGTSSVAIAFGSDVPTSLEGSVIVELVANLAARLYPILTILPGSGKGCSALADKLARLALSINPQIEISNKATSAKRAVVVGAQARRLSIKSERVVYAGSARWLGAVSYNQPLSCGDSAIPFGAAAAACLASAELFKMSFATGRRTRLRTFSVFTMSGDSYDVGPEPDWPLDLGEVHLAGCGAIGSAVTWALSKLPSLKGHLHLVDPESLDLSNLQRYVTATYSDFEKTRSKVSIAAEVVDSTITATKWHGTWGGYVAACSDTKLRLVLSAVDSADARCAIQAALPRRTLNAWTQADDLGLSRHSFGTAEACLMCLYLPTTRTIDFDRIVASALGMPDDLMAVRKLLSTSAPVDPEFLSRVADANSVDYELLAEFVGRPLATFYADAVCGGMLLHSGRSGPAAHVPLAFQSAMAGTLLGAELVAEAIAGPRGRTVTQFNIMAPIGSETSQFVAARDGCICGDADYLNRYRAKYEVHSRRRRQL